MSKTVVIQSAAQFQQVISSSKVVVVDFYADWCGPCKAIAPVYEQLSGQLSRAGKITFTKVNVDQQTQITQSYNISAMPTFLVLKQGRETTRIQGADGAKLQDAVKKLAAEAESLDSAGGAASGSGSGSGAGPWAGAAAPRGYSDVSDQVDVQGLELLNGDGEFGGARTLFDGAAPGGLRGGKARAEGGGKGKRDWVESDTDEQLLLFVPFMATLKIHTLQVTSLPAAGDAGAPMRPRTLRLYTNRPHNLGFEEAEDTAPTQEVVLDAKHWDAATGTASVELRFVKFQKCSSVVVFVVDGDGDGDRVRLDRVRFVGETGTKREMGKLEKVGDEPGE